MRIERIDINNQSIFSEAVNESKEPLSFNEAISSKGMNGQSDMMYYLKLQIEMMRESREYQAISNVLKAKHDAATNAIRNMR